LFSFALSVCFAGESYSKAKLAGVCCTIAGTVMVAYADATGDDDAADGDSVEVPSVLLGDGIALIGAIAYSCYTVVIKIYVPNDDAVAMPLLFGYLGMLNALILAPALLLAAVFSRGGIFENLSPEVFGLICLEGLFDNVLSDYLWARAVVLTTPTIATVGLSLTIPLAFLSDAFFNGVVPSPLSALGALTVIAGFILVNVGDGSCESRSKFILMKGVAAFRWLKALCRLS
jgi:solute carrier family 35 protein F5